MEHPLGEPLGIATGSGAVRPAAGGRTVDLVKMMLCRPRTAVVALLVVLAGLVLPAPAAAEPPLRLSGQVTDRVDALAERAGEAQAALQRLRDDAGLQLFVVFVRSFDDTAPQQWADRTASRSGLGVRDAVLAVATADRAYAYTFDDGYRLTDAQLEVVDRVAIEPALAANDWAGAVVGAADGYRALTRGEAVTAPRIQPGDPNPGGGSADGGSGLAGGGLGWLGVLLLCLLVPLAAVGGGALLWWRARRRGTTAAPAGVDAPAGANAADPTAGVPTGQLADRANSLLVELDDDLRTSERELALATAAYGAPATTAFQSAVDAARHEVAEAFRLRLTLDEEPAPDEATRRRTLTEIIARCERADTGLDAQAEAFDRLRDLQGRVEQVSGELAARRGAVQARLPAAEAAVQGLNARYTGATVATVAGNVGQAGERLGFADAALKRAAEALTAGDRAAAAVAVRGAEQAVDQAEQLLDAIERAGTDLAAARAAVDTLLAEVESDLAAARVAREAGGDPQASAALAAAVSGAEQALAAVRAALTGPTSDPAAAVRRLEQADAALDQALAGARDAGERADRARAMLAQTLPVARAEVAAAADFVTTRRGAVGGQARAWLAEAQRHLARAEGLAGSDPVAALAAAQEAHRLAVSAGQAAQEDVAGWGGPGGFAGPAGDPMGAFAGAVLGGILSGGLRSRGGWGGASWGGSGGFGGGFGGSGRRGGGGGFGGGGGRRGGGGRF